jgi:hypothetical protein
MPTLDDLNAGEDEAYERWRQRQVDEEEKQMTSETPETDAQEKYTVTYQRDGVVTAEFETVAVEFAERLERERDEAMTKGALRREGMTPRDYFAAAALQGMLACSEGRVKHPGADDWKQSYAMYAFEYADAMLAERAK